MNTAVFADLVASRSRLVAALLGGLLALSIGYLALYPSLQEQLGAFVGDLPEIYRALVGDADISTPEGYVRSQVLSLVGPMLVAAVAIAGGAALARSERDRTLMGTLLSPAPRRELVLSHAAYVIGVALAGGVVVVVAIVVGSPLAGASFAVGDVLAGAVHLVGIAAAAGTVALAAGAATGSPGAAFGAGWALVALGFLVNSVGEITQGLAWLTEISPWGWYGAGAALQDGVDVVGLALLVTTTLVAVAVATVTFTRRDLQV